MCTVTYLPTEAGCLITSNRDETTFRGLAAPPSVQDYHGAQMIYPRDPHAGGTWIAANEALSVCLYNGAFEPHDRKPPYRMSRGFVPLECIAAGSIESFARSFDPEGIEPFSLVVFDGSSLEEFKWDETTFHRLEHNPKEPHIWASVTLYDPEVRKQRQAWFDEWLDSRPRFDQPSIIGFHTQEKGDRYTGLLIEREQGLRTVSVTSLLKERASSIHMVHHDLVEDHASTVKLP